MTSFQAASENSRFSFEKLLMPGKLIEGHAEYESDCKLCHSQLKQISEPALCLDCHEEVNEDIKNRVGYHGRVEKIEKRECKDCHTDHIGREGDIVGLDKDNFKHGYTDFKLTGKHKEIACSSCHLPNKKYRDASTQCIDCHNDIEPHRGEFGRECNDCHSTKKWSETQFDHNETKFPLNGLHKEVECKACHADEHYKNLPQDCFSCHAINDVHGGANGSSCDNCHNESGWKKLTFDHNKDTRFPLKNSHNDLLCSACHLSSGFEKKVDRSCISCHKDDDVHKGDNGKACQDCHATTRWFEVIFKHDRDTDFKLLGKHENLECKSCHREGIKDKKIEQTCISCHEQDDVHKGQEGDECGQCHNPTGWEEKVLFDHDLTRFPLLGMHAVTHCENCHESKAFQDAAKQCIDCHQEEDEHNSALGIRCESCHSPNSWRLWLFDHDTQTNFPLDGSHTGLSCNACHKKPVKNEIKLSQSCASCHLNDDIHNKRFGQACDRCHTTESFNQIRMQQ